MAFTVDRPSSDGKRVYRYELESYRDAQGRPRHRQKYLGRVVTDKAGRKRLKPKTPRPETAVEEVLPFGDLALLWDTAHSLGVVETIDRLAPRHAGTPVGPALTLLAINHLTGRRALADVQPWYERSMLRYWAGVEGDELSEARLLRVLDEVCHQSEDVLRDKTWLISQALDRKVQDVYGSESRFVYYDRTQIVYVGEECYWGEFGYGRDAHRDRRKIGMGVVVRRGDGFPILYRVYRGNQVDVTTVESVADRLKHADLEDLIVVVDRGMASAKTIKALQDEGFRVLSGVKGTEKAFDLVVQDLEDAQIEREENRLRRRGRRVFLAVERTLEGRGGKYVVYQDPRVRGQLKGGFLRALSEREEALGEIARELERGQTTVKEARQTVALALGKMKKYFEWEIRGRRLSWSVIPDQVAWRLNRLGRYVIHSTDPSLTREEAIDAYLDKDEVEKVWRLGKGGMGLVGVKHYKRDRVVAYLFVCYLAYLLWTIVRHRLRALGFDVSPDKALDHLRRVEAVRLVRGKEEFLQTPRPIKIEDELVTKLDLDRWKKTGV